MNRLVYDSDNGRTICPRCDRPVARCRCDAVSGPTAPPEVDDGIVRVRREVRRGKPMTVIVGLKLADAELKQFAKVLKKKCSTGGSAKAGNIELQGDHRDAVVRELQQRGHQVKLAGG